MKQTTIVIALFQSASMHYKNAINQFFETFLYKTAIFFIWGCCDFCMIINTWNTNFQMYKLVLEKAEEPEIKLSTSAGWSTSMRVQKNIYFCFIDYAEAFDCVDHNKLWKILKDGNTRPPNLPVEKSVCMSGSNS